MSCLSATSRLALLMIASARLFTTSKPILTTTFIISPHILVIAKQVSLAVNSCDFAIFVLKNQTFWKRVVKWSPLFEQRGQSHALLQNDLQAIRQIERIDVLNNHRPSNQSSDRILLVLTYHPLNERIKIILIRTFNTLTADPETREIFSKLPLVAYHCDGNFCDILVRTRKPTQFSRGYISVLHTYQHVSSDSKVCAPQCSFGVKKAFSCQTSCLVYCISCGRCASIYIGVMGRTLRQRFGEHLRSIEKNLPGFPATEFQHSWSLDPRRFSSRNYALRGKRATEAPGDAPYFSPWHQSSARLKLRLPFRSQRPHAEREQCIFFSSFMAKANIATFVLCNSTDEGPGPKCLEKNTNQNTALLFIIFTFFFLFLTFPYVLLNILITNFRLYTKYTYR